MNEPVIPFHLSWMRELSGAEYLATGVRVGLPQQAHLTTAHIGRFIEANGYRISGPNRKVFLQRPSAHTMDKEVVEMQFPVERIRSAYVGGGEVEALASRYGRSFSHIGVEVR